MNGQPSPPQACPVKRAVSRGSRILPCPAPSSPSSFLKNRPTRRWFTPRSMRLLLEPARTSTRVNAFSSSPTRISRLSSRRKTKVVHRTRIKPARSSAWSSLQRPCSATNLIQVRHTSSNGMAYVRPISRGSSDHGLVSARYLVRALARRDVNKRLPSKAIANGGRSLDPDSPPVFHSVSTVLV